MAYDYEKMQKSVKLFFEAIGDDPSREGIKDTPKRVADMYAETMNGYFLDINEHDRMFENEEDYNGPVIVKNVELYSLCEHHLQPFIGEISIAYLPKNKVIGLSKLVRVARIYAKRPQVQERMTQQIVDNLHDILQPVWTVVRYEAEHFCMRCRGVRVKGSTTVTQTHRGGNMVYPVPDNVFSI